jgi:Domain of unknown function (DUF4349)
MPATDTIDFEREFAELVRELRAIPSAAPGNVRERVRALGEPAPRRSLPRLPWRRSVLVLAPVCVLGVVIAAVVHGVVNSSAPKQQALSLSGEAQHGAAGSTASGKNVFGPATDATTPQVLRSPLVPPTGGRHQDYDAWMRIRVRDLDALTQQTNEAMQVVRSYGGYVASVNQTTTAGAPGEADLVLRVPVAHVEDALVRLAGLGTVLDRRLSIVDLEQTLRQQRQRILRLRLFIARATEELKQALPADVRLRLQFQLEQAKASLSQVTRANAGTLREAALSRISLTLTTQQAATPVKKGGVGRFHRAASDAGSFLAGAGAVVLFLLIVLSPVIVLVALAVLGLRAYRRREERRLLAA